MEVPEGIGVRLGTVESLHVTKTLDVEYVGRRLMVEDKGPKD